MSVKKHSCITIHCDGCGKTYSGYEDEFTVHFGSVDELAKQQEQYPDAEADWHIEGEQHYCPSCACERETNHALTDTAGATHYCRCGEKSDWKPGAPA